MGHDWIMDVLIDLRTYARANDLPKLAEHLDDAALLAEVEVASTTKGAGPGGCGTSEGSGKTHRRLGVG